jgi:hypothetical protein
MRRRVPWEIPAWDCGGFFTGIINLVRWLAGK